MTLEDRGAASTRAGERDVTLKDVARLAGVSPMTVSRTLTKPELVSEETRQRVSLAVERTGYVSNSLAGGLTSRRTRLIATVVPSIAHSLFSDMVQALIDSVGSAGYQTMLGLSGYGAEMEERLVETILSRRPEAIALTGVDHTARTKKLILSSRIPVVELWDFTSHPLDFSVGFSHENVGAAAYRYLIERGYQLPAVARSDDTRAARRGRGFAEAARELGHAEPKDIVFSEQLPQHQRGLKVLEGLRLKAPNADAVFCSSDSLAQAISTAAQRSGMSVPSSLAILGFGNQSFASDTIPALSTINIDGHMIGKIAAERLIKAIIDPDSDKILCTNTGFSIITRDST